MSQTLVRFLALTGVFCTFVGCGTRVTQVKQPVDIIIKVMMGDKPVNGVTMTLQPMVEGAQAALPVEKGELKGTVVPGVYTYYIDSGKSEAALASIPQAYRLGDKDRQLDINQPGSYEIQLD